MPRVSKLSLSPIDLGKESLGARVARIRKERGYTQLELAARVGTLQTLVTGYENDRLRLTAELAVRFALALDVTLDELLNPKTAKMFGKKPSRKVLPRLRQIESLPGAQRSVWLKTTDSFLENAALKSVRRA